MLEDLKIKQHSEDSRVTYEEENFQIFNLTHQILKENSRDVEDSK